MSFTLILPAKCLNVNCKLDGSIDERICEENVDITYLCPISPFSSEVIYCISRKSTHISSPMNSISCSCNRTNADHLHCFVHQLKENLEESISQLQSQRRRRPSPSQRQRRSSASASTLHTSDLEAGSGPDSGPGSAPGMEDYRKVLSDSLVI